MTRYLKGKKHSWLLKADASFGLLAKACPNNLLLEPLRTIGYSVNAA